MLCFVSYNSHFVEEALLMFPGWWGRLLSNNASPHLRERHQTVQCEGRDTGRDNDALIMYSLELTWDTAWDTLSQQPHHFLVAAADSPRPSIKQTPTRIKQTKLSWNLIYMTVSQNVTTGPLLFWVSAWRCVTATCAEPRCPGGHWWWWARHWALMVSGINEHFWAADTRIMLLMDPTPHLSPEKIARKLWTIKKHFIYILREYLDLILNKYWLTI